MMFFSERKKLADKYEKWISENKNILDCPLNVISWLVSEGYLCKTKAVDLEAKLVESEADKKALICDYESRMTKEQELMSWLEHNNEELKQQLAEKEKELLQKERKIEDLMLCEFVATTLDFNKLSADNCKLREQLAEHNQDKISFAVEHINKLKNDLYDNEKINIRACDFDEIDNILDNQIKQLKEMK